MRPRAGAKPQVLAGLRVVVGGGSDRGLLDPGPLARSLRSLRSASERGAEVIVPGLDDQRAALRAVATRFPWLARTDFEPPAGAPGPRRPALLFFLRAGFECDRFSLARLARAQLGAPRGVALVPAFVDPAGRPLRRPGGSMTPVQELPLAWIVRAADLEAPGRPRFLDVFDVFDVNVVAPGPGELMLGELMLGERVLGERVLGERVPGEPVSGEPAPVDGRPPRTPVPLRESTIDPASAADRAPRRPGFRSLRP